MNAAVAPATEPVVAARNLAKVYQLGEQAVHALRDVSFDIYPGEYIAIMGPSGSGKSTLMNIVGCLDTPTSGSYELDDIEVSKMSDDELAVIRNRKIGFVFQSFNLLPRTSAVEQVELPMIYAGVRDRRQRALAALESVGLGDRVHHRPTELSGGQQQRVAIARALVTDPALILADEPTGNLDSGSGHEVMELFRELHASGRTIVLITHDHDVAANAPRQVHVFDGRIVEQAAA